jgi:Flp pilus assembly pilin Flp
MSSIAEPSAPEAATQIAPSIREIAAIGYGACRRVLRRISRDQNGATAITTALVLLVLVGFVGLGTEVGMWYAERRAMQNASDAAALGAGFDIYKNGKKSTGIVAAGQADSAKNGFTNGQEKRHRHRQLSAQAGQIRQQEHRRRNRRQQDPRQPVRLVLPGRPGRHQRAQRRDHQIRRRLLHPGLVTAR